jgi:hypothetical protein
MKRIIFLLLPLAVACSQPEKESAEDEAKRKDVERMYQQVEKQNEAIRLENKEREEWISNYRISLYSAELFMTRRCERLNHTLVKKGTVKLEDGSTFYVFLSVYGEYLCISVVSDRELDILSADCGPQGRMVDRWTRILTTQSFD